MTRQAVRRGFEYFVDDLIERTYDEFDVVRALRGRSGTTGRMVERLLKDNDALYRHVVRPELRSHRRRVVDQFEVVLEYAADPDATREAYRDRFLANDTYAEALRDGIASDRRDRILEDLVDRRVGLAQATEPLVDSPADDFWTAATDALTESEAIDLIETHFAFTGPVREHRDAFRFETVVDPGDVLPTPPGPLGNVPTVSVDYTDEAVRAMTVAEEETIESARREASERFSKG